MVIPLYNKGHTIVGTLNSVLAQDFGDFEVVIVDDGSTDDGPERVEQTFSDPRIRVIRQEHSGDGAARNRGVEAARRDWIALLDADDVWLPGYLTAMRAASLAFPAAGMLCCGGVTRYRDGSGYVRESRPYRITQEVDFFKGPFFFGDASSTVFRRDLFPAAGGFPAGMRHYGEAVFFFGLALNTRVVFVPALLTVYNRGIAGQVTGDERGNVAGIVDSANQIYRYWGSLDAEKKNPGCLSAVLSSLRIGLRYSLLHNDDELLSHFLENVDAGLLLRLHPVERFWYRRPNPGVGWVLGKSSGLLRRIRRLPSPRFSDNVDACLANSSARSGSTQFEHIRPGARDGVAGVED